MRDKYINGLITGEEFKTWIDGTKLQKQTIK